MRDYTLEGGSTLPDQRTEYRLTGRARVTLELEAADSVSGLEGRQLVSYTTDLSANGIRLTTSEELPLQALLPTAVVLDGSDTVFNLTGEVVWCNAQDASSWAVGLKILESDGTSFVEWIEAVAAAMVQD